MNQLDIIEKEIEQLGGFDKVSAGIKQGAEYTTIKNCKICNEAVHHQVFFSVMDTNEIEGGKMVFHNDALQTHVIYKF